MYNTTDSFISLSYIPTSIRTPLKQPTITFSARRITFNRSALKLLNSDHVDIAYNPETGTVRISPAKNEGSLRITNKSIKATPVYRAFYVHGFANTIKEARNIFMKDMKRTKYIATLDSDNRTLYIKLQ